MRMLPILTLMMHTVPKGIEASMYALITASITISVNWGGDLMGSIVAMYLRIDANNMDNFKTGLYYKLFTFVISMAFIPLLPTNQEVMELK